MTSNSNPQPDHTPTGLEKLLNKFATDIWDAKDVVYAGDVLELPRKRAIQAILTELEQIIGHDDEMENSTDTKSISRLQSTQAFYQNKLRAEQRQRLAAWGKRG